MRKDKMGNFGLVGDVEKDLALWLHRRESGQ